MDTLDLSLLLGANVLTLITASVGVVKGFQNAEKIQEVHLTINYRLTQFQDQTEKLLLASVITAHADGKAEGIAEARAQMAASVAPIVKQ